MAAPAFDQSLYLRETLQAAAVATGNGTAISMRGFGRLTVSVTMAGTATITFEGSIDDGTTWFALGMALSTTGALASAPTATATYYMPAGAPALTNFRARISAWTSGATSAVALKAPINAP
jgi:hypothetical protein